MNFICKYLKKIWVTFIVIYAIAIIFTLGMRLFDAVASGRIPLERSVNSSGQQKENQLSKNNDSLTKEMPPEWDSSRSDYKPPVEQDGGVINCPEFKKIIDPKKNKSD